MQRLSIENHRLSRNGHIQTGGTSEKHGLWSNVLVNPEGTATGKLLAKCSSHSSYLERKWRPSMAASGPFSY